jgi:hypothetical protein
MAPPSQLSSPSPTASPSLVPVMIFGYMLVFQPTLLAILLFNFGDSTKPLLGLDAAAMIPRGAEVDRVTIAIYGAAVVVCVLFGIVPRLVARSILPAAGAPPDPTRNLAGRLLAPYLVRLSLAELVTVLGFVLGIVRQAPSLMVPFFAVGLLLTLLSPPTPGFFERFAP